MGCIMKQILPSYPLLIKDPNFSLCSPYDRLTDGDIETWYGEPKHFYGFLKLGGEEGALLDERELFAYLTGNARFRHFRARTVQDGTFILLL